MIKENKQDNKKGVTKEKTLHDKVVHNKSSTASLEQLHSKPPFHYNPTIECMGTMWLCIHPLPQTPPWWLMKLTQCFQLFMTWGLNYLLGWCKQANCVSSDQALKKKKAVPFCGNLLTRRAFDFRNTVSVSYISSLQFAAAPWGGRSVQLWACERERRDRRKEREEAKLKLIMLLAYRRCVDILLAISKM